MAPSNPARRSCRPPSCSLVSANGPSITWAADPAPRMEVAVGVGCNASPATYFLNLSAPWYTRRRLHASAASSRASSIRQLLISVDQQEVLHRRFPRSKVRTRPLRVVRAGLCISVRCNDGSRGGNRQPDVSQCWDHRTGVSRALGQLVGYQRRGRPEQPGIASPSNLCLIGFECAPQSHTHANPETRPR